ncbi:MAG: tyrosine-type recombinase/integrase [Anaerolineaceae bacterium]
MINRENWLDVKKYLIFLENIMQVDEKTVHRRHSQLTHLLIWADAKQLGQAQGITPTFPAFLATSRRDGKAISLSPETMRATCNVVRVFFAWIKKREPRRYSRIDPSWIDTIQPARSRGMQSTAQIHEFYNLDEMRRIVEYQPKTILEERDRAACCMLYLSAMRADAFVTLPISCVNLKNFSIDQYPGMGVRTKNHKAAQTYLLPIPELLEVVQIWDDKVRSQLPESAMWFSPIDQNSDNLVPLYVPGMGRREKVTDGIMRICLAAGLKYKSPHKFRSGHIVFAERVAKNFEDLKSISLNVMHDDISTTNKVYGRLSGDTVKNAILRLYAKPTGEEVNTDVMSQLKQIIKEHPELLDAPKQGDS